MRHRMPHFIAGLVVALASLAPTPAPAQSAGAAPVPVQLAPLSEVLVDLEHRAPAEVLPLNDSLMAAEVNAVVRSVGADVGARVAAGELLVELDDRDYRLQLEAAEAALASAQARHAEAAAKLERARTLGASNYVSADELLTRETALAVGEAEIRSARAQVHIAQRNLDKCRVLAPFDGAVQERAAQVGAYVTVGSPLLRFVQSGQLELDAQVPEADAASLETASRLAFESRGQHWDVRLLRLSPVVDPGRRARRARFGFAGDVPEPGRSGELVWEVASGQLPASLLSRRGGALGVFLAREGRAEFVPVPGAEEGRPSPVDLPRDSQVVVQGQDRLQDGDPIASR